MKEVSLIGLRKRDKNFRKRKSKTCREINSTLETTCVRTPKLQVPFFHVWFGPMPTCRLGPFPMGKREKKVLEAPPRCANRQTRTPLRAPDLSRLPKPIHLPRHLRDFRNAEFMGVLVRFMNLFLSRYLKVCAAT